MTFWKRIFGSGEPKTTNPEQNLGNRPPATDGCRIAEVVRDCIQSPDTLSALNRLRSIQKLDSPEIDKKSVSSGADGDAGAILRVAHWGVQHQPDNPASWYALYIALHFEALPYQQAKPEMIRALEQLTRHAPSFIYGWCAMGGFFSAIGRGSDAVGAYDKALAIETNEVALAGKAMALDNNSDYRGALRCYQELAERYPNGAEGQRYRNAISELRSRV